MGKASNQRNQNVYAIDQTPPKRKKFTTHDLCSFHGMSDNQRLFIDAYYHSDEDTFALLGYPGTGKTFLAVRAGLDDVLDRDTGYERLIIVRSAVELRDTGFKPGDETEKDMVYAKPYIGLMQDITDHKHDGAFETMIENGSVVFATTSNARGVTWDNAIIVVDEVQNMNYEEIRTIYTRGGRNCRFIFCGDSGQNDLYRKKNDVSGLSDWVRVLDDMGCTSIGFYSYDDIVRSGRIKEMIKSEIKLKIID